MLRADAPTPLLGAGESSVTQLFMTHPGPLEVDGDPVPALPPGFELRAASASESPALSDLLEAAFDEPWGVTRTDDVLLAAPDVVRTWVVTSGGRLAGTASERLLPEEYPGQGYVHYVGVHPDFRGHRIGQVVTRACLHGFLERGLDRAVLKTDDWRVPAVRTYLRLGFVPEYRSDAERAAWSAMFRGVADGGALTRLVDG